MAESPWILWAKKVQTHRTFKHTDRKEDTHPQQPFPCCLWMHISFTEPVPESRMVLFISHVTCRLRSRICWGAPMVTKTASVMMLGVAPGDWTTARAGQADQCFHPLLEMDFHTQLFPCCWKGENTLCQCTCYLWVQINMLCSCKFTNTVP